MTSPALSFPKDRIRVLLLEGISFAGEKVFRAEGYQVDSRRGALSEDELVEALADGVHLLGLRSNTKLTARAVEAATSLHAVGAFCIGTNQIDLPAAAADGVAVFNAPYSNTRSVVELAVAEIIALSRGLTAKNAAMHAGQWAKSATGSHEVRGKTLGIVGYGSIGSQLSVVAEALGMNVISYDIADRLRLGNARTCESLPDLLGEADVVSVHVDGRPGNAGIFAAAEFAAMREGALFLNLSRGFTVDETALADAVSSGHLAGAAVDVFGAEPRSNDDPFTSALQGLPNVILTPHVGGSTLEAQQDIGRYVSGKLIDFVNTGATSMSVNLPELALPAQVDAHRLIHLHRNEPGVLAAINAALAGAGANVLGQYLATRDDVGYVTTDIDRAYDRSVLAELKALPATIKLRELY